MYKTPYIGKSACFIQEPANAGCAVADVIRKNMDHSAASYQAVHARLPGRSEGLLHNLPLKSETLSCQS